MRGIPFVRPGLLALLLLLLALALTPFLAATDASAAALPERCIIEDVPLWQQLDAFGCGAASAQMVMDHWGPFVDQREVYAAARTVRGKPGAKPDRGTAVPDLARAGQFSALSFAAGDAYDAASWGYTGRPLGYGAFYYGSEEPWLDELKAVVAAGYPVVCLTDWLPDMAGPHYRVVVGYDDAKQVLYFNDPWVREFRGEIDARGCFVQLKAEANPYSYGSMEWSYEDWLAVWDEPGDAWGVPGYRYNAVLIAPWKVVIEAPETVAAGATFEVTATVTYPCVGPFGRAPWPTFPASATTIALSLPNGWMVAGGAEMPIGELAAGQSAKATFMVTAGAGVGSCDIEVTGSGLVSGSLAPRRDYPAYDYTDLIGGSGAATIVVVAD